MGKKTSSTAKKSTMSKNFFATKMDGTTGII